MRKRGEDIAILAILVVDIANMRKQEKRGGATGGGRGRHSKPEEAREKGRRYRGRDEGEVSRIRRLETGWSARGFGGTKSHRGRGTPCYKPFLGV